MAARSRQRSEQRSIRPARDFCRAQQPAQGVPRSPRQTALAVGVLVVCALSGWSNSLDGPFVLDDPGSILLNPSLESLSTALSPPPNATTTARPVLNLSLYVNRALGGTAVRGYHLVNLLIHVLVSLLLFGLLRRTLHLPRVTARLGLDRLPGDQAARTRTALALAVALLWQVHPLQTAAVTYVVQRAEMLVALFYLLTLYCVARRATAPPVAAWRWSLLAVGCCCLGMASKEVMVTAPVACLLYDRIFIAGSFRSLLKDRWAMYLGLAASWALLGGLLLSVGFRRAMHDPTHPRFSRLDYLLTQSGFILRYLRLVFVPHPLVFDYGVHVARGAAAIVPQTLAVVGLLSAVLVALRRAPLVGFVGLLFFLVLAPTSSIVKISTQTGAEHRMYLPLAAVISLVVLGAFGLWSRPRRRPRRPAASPASTRLGLPAPGLVALAVVALTLIGLTRARNQDYGSAMRLWQDTARKWPTNGRAHRSVANQHLVRNEPRAAIAALDRAIALHPRDFRALASRGHAHHLLGDRGRALADLDRSIALRPDAAPGYVARGDVHAAAGDRLRAVADYDRALQLQPDAVQALSRRADSRVHLGQLQAAIDDYSRVVTLAPDRLSARRNRAIALLRSGQLARARADLEALQAAGELDAQLEAVLRQLPGSQ